MQTQDWDAADLVERLEMTIRLRWVGLAIGLLSLIVVYLISGLALDIVPSLLIAVFAFIYNVLISFHVKIIPRRRHTHSKRRAMLVVAIVSALDLIALTMGVYYTGGIGSPYLFLVLVYIITSSVVFSPLVGYCVAACASLLMVLVDLLGGVIPPASVHGFYTAGVTLYGTLKISEPIVLLLFSSMACLGAYVVSHVTTRLKRERQAVSRLLREREKTLAQLAGLQQIGTEISSLADLETVLNLIVSKARDLFATDMAFLALREGRTDDIVITVTEGEGSDSLKGARLQPGQGMGGQVMATGRPVTVVDYTADERLADSLGSLVADAQIRSGIAVPLSVGQRRIGVLYVFNRQTTVFDAHDADVLLALANQAAIAIDNARLYSDLRQAALTDNLTGLYNRHHLQTRLQEEMARVVRYGGRLAVIAADCDSLKEVNDRFGHQAGDQLLIQLARLFQVTVRQGDIVCRYGGDEFVVLLPEADILGAQQVAERIRRRVEETPLQVDGATVSITTSLGLAAYPEHATDEEDLLRKADNALYRAKSLGKNRVCAFSMV